MEIIETQEHEDDSQSVDTFASIIRPEHPGSIRLYGCGITKTVLKGKVGDFGPLLDDTNKVMQQKMEEMEERMQQKMQEKFDAQRSTMEQDIKMNVIAQLQRLNPELQLHPNMLRFNIHSPAAAANQLNNRPSIGSNNQG